MVQQRIVRRPVIRNIHGMSYQKCSADDTINISVRNNNSFSVHSCCCCCIYRKADTEQNQRVMVNKLIIYSTILFIYATGWVKKVTP